MKTVFKVTWGVLLLCVESLGVTTVLTTSAVPDCGDGFYNFPTCTPCGNCVNNAPCDKITGACSSCAPGYNFSSNETCTSPCAEGTWGQNCEEECGPYCQNLCNNINGQCTCEPGYKPSLCRDVCDDGRYGQDCKETCGACATGSVCDHVSGVCPSGCQPGFVNTSQCKTSCSEGQWGQYCSKTCSPHCRDDQRCNKATGSCTCKPGYIPPLCTEACSDGQWGQDCGETCSSHCQDGESCDKANGYCTCKPGYLPLQCTDKCAFGMYGQNCSYTCGFCLNETTTCDYITGNCDRCVDNRKMPLCQECFAGHWGPTCGQRCGQCGRDGHCDPVSGNCVASGCLDGWTSPKCDVECRDGLYGQACAQKCGRCRHNSICRHDSGICEQDCEDGYTGVLCQTEKESLVAPIVGAVLGAGALIAIAIIGAVCYMKRCSVRNPRIPKKDFLDITSPESVSGPHETVALNESQLYQNVDAAMGSQNPAFNNYDQADLSRQDSHAYTAHSPGKVGDQTSPHTYQNTGLPSKSSAGVEKGKQSAGDRPGAPEPMYGNVQEGWAPEATYGNVKSDQGLYGNIIP